MTRGVTDYGVAVPTYHVTAEAYEEAWDRFEARIDRKAVTAYDEDAVTMATQAAADVDAGSDGDADAPGDGVDTLAVATTTPPQAGSLASAPVARTLGLDSRCRTMEFGASWKAGLEALDAALSFGDGLAVAADAPEAPLDAGTEHVLGAGAAAFAVGDGGGDDASGSEDVLAGVVGSAHYVDAYLPAKFRTDGEVTDLGLGGYTTEGFVEALSAVVGDALDDADLSVEDVDHAVLPQDDVKMSWRGGKRLGFDGDQMSAGFLVKRLGFAGAASPLLGLAAAFDAAGPGATVLVAGYGYGHGASAFVFETTDAVADADAGVEAALDGTEELSYPEYVRLREVSD
jgi:3-hydroxy-3-methylglutaryl CoA synthase